MRRNAIPTVLTGQLQQERLTQEFQLFINYLEIANANRPWIGFSPFCWIYR